MTIPPGATPSTLPPEQRQFIDSAVQRLANEFSGVFGPETIGRFVDDSLSDLQSARLKNFLPLFVERFARDRLWSLAKSEGKLATDRPTILFLCVHNAGRSQIATAWARHLAGDRVKIMSGGSTPGDEIHPHAGAVMAEKGIDIGGEFPKPWTDEIVRAADVVITMGCGDACPIFPGKRYEDWPVPDPSGRGLGEVRAIRDEIEARVRELLRSVGVEPAA